MRFGSLFSGIGGFDLGFEQAGLSCAWQVEIDGDCNRVLSRQWKAVTRHNDVRDIRQLEPVDVICGGFPCQDLSVAGKRKGLAGERSGLWFEFLRIVGLNRPRFIVIENVPGLLSSDEGRDFAVILQGLVECGYCLAWRVVDAQFYGVAQRRRRVFIVGSLGEGSCAEILFESESVSWNPPTRREAGARVAPTIESGANRTGGIRPPGSTVDTAETLQVSATLDQRGRGPTDAVMMNLIYHENIDGKVYGSAECPTLRDFQKDVPMVTHALSSEDADASEDRTARGTPIIAAPLTANYGKQLDNSDRNGGPPNLIAFSSKDHGADAGEIAPTLRSQNFDKSRINGGGQVAIAFAENQRGELRTSDVSPRLSCAGGKPGSGYPAVAFTERTRSEGRTFEAQEELAYAITNPGSGGRTHSRQVAGQFGVRRLTPRECERLQGFPDDWTLYDANGKEISDSARYRMLGNAVAVPVARWIGTRIRMSFDQRS